jgi:transcriptional regulator with XRE-family HTH domain
MHKTQQSTMNKNGFSKRCRDLRRQKNLSQAELGKLVGLHFTHIGRYERGLSRPSAEALKNLAEALGVTTDYLIEGETDDIAKTKLEDRELLHIFREVETLPDEDKYVIKKFLDAFLTKKKVQELSK